VKLTELENHRTASEYENALILKTFAFQFINSCAPRLRTPSALP